MLRVHLQLAKSLFNFKASKTNKKLNSNTQKFYKCTLIKTKFTHLYGDPNQTTVQRAVHIHEVDCALSKKISHQWDLYIWSESIKGITFPGRTQWLHVSVF
jgi:hypothetical protein